MSVDPNSLVIDPTLIPLYSKPVLLAMPSFTYVRDTRDNPIDSHKGSYNIAELGSGHQRSGFGSELREGAPGEFDLLHLQEALGLCAEHADRYPAPLWH